MGSKAMKLIASMIEERSSLKQDVFERTFENFNLLKTVLQEVVTELRKEFVKKDSRLEFYYKDKGEFEAEVKIAGDILIFHMHTNIFQFDKSNSIWKSSYLKDKEGNAYVGMINVYNFLADSFKFQRSQDSGYLIARMFVNHENHFMIQGKRQLGFLYNDFINSVMNKKQMRNIVESAIIYTLGFDLYTPPYKSVQEVTVGQIQALSQNLNVVTGKRLGFKFSFDDDTIE